MSYREQLFKNSLDVIEEIYNESKYNPKVDLYRSYDIINSVNDAQLSSKQWLVDQLVPNLQAKSEYTYSGSGGLRV